MTDADPTPEPTGDIDPKTGFPIILTADQVIERQLVPVSKATLIQLAKRHGVGRKLGRLIIFRPSDIKDLLDALPGPSGFEKTVVRTGMSAERAYHEALRLSEQGSKKKRPQKR